MQHKIYGLTGGIGVGKSVVAGMFEAQGIPVLYADKISREVMKPGSPAFKEIVLLFGESVVSNGELDRKLIRKLVFEDRGLKEKLEKITHRRIIDMAKAQAAELHKSGANVVILEAAVLIEAGFVKEVDGVIVVIAKRERQLERGMRRDGANREGIEAIIKAQLTDVERKKHATFLIDNSGNLKETERQVKEISKKLKLSCTK